MIFRYLNPIALGLLLAAAPALAQNRPTLSEAESRIGVLEGQLSALQAEQTATQAAVCTKVELDGDSYRPFFCGGDCGCIDTSTATGCSEISAGIFELLIVEDTLVPGTCEEITEPVDRGPCTDNSTECGGRCSESSLDPCTLPGGAECVNGEQCHDVGGLYRCVGFCEYDDDCTGTCEALYGYFQCSLVCAQSAITGADQCSPDIPCPFGICSYDDGGDPNYGTCRLGCSQDSDCIGTTVVSTECTAPVVACAVDGDCPTGWTCDTAEGQCGRNCFTWNPQVCDLTFPLPIPYTLTGVADTEAPEPVSCDGPSGSVAVSSSDALACIAQAEVVIGSACAYLCGDGEIDPGETCDDGNTIPGDGCDASCQTEP